jgi:pSer/pThr/pTyr-binding forkhead associated (FHA) protein
MSYPTVGLTLMSGPRDGDQYRFEVLFDSELFTINIGRRDTCDICLSYDSQVSRVHAHVLFDGRRYWLEDLDSRNGTLMNNKPVKKRVKLIPGTLFRVGRTWLRVDPPSEETRSYTQLMDDDSLPF